MLNPTIEIIEIKDRPIKNKTTYYKVAEPVDDTPLDWFGHQVWMYEYRGFLISRDTDQNTLWCIKTKEREEPPIPIRGRFTHEYKAKNAVDAFIEGQKASLKVAQVKDNK